jgi:iron complex outermembrane receptor protein
LHRASAQEKEAMQHNKKKRTPADFCTETRIALIAALATFSLCGAHAEFVGATGLGPEEIVVTAQRRPENVQTVPISISVYERGDLDKNHIETMEDVVARTPGFSMNRINIGEPQFAIRGVGSISDSAAGDPTVGVFFDEFYVGRVSGAAFDLYDLERIEVLRGPQGTLYGRNTAGGAINIVPRRPQREFALATELTFGNYQMLNSDLVLNAPLAQDSGARLAVHHAQHDGYSRNILSGTDVDHAASNGARLTIANDEQSATRLRLLLDWQNANNGGNARVPGPVFPDQTGANAVALDALLRLWPLDANVRQTYADPASFQKRELRSVFGRLEHDFAVGELTVLAGWRSTDLHWYEDLDGLKPFGNPPLPTIPPATYGWIVSSKDMAQENADQYSLEVRLRSADNVDTSWLIGANYFSEGVDRNERFLSRFALLPAGSGDVSFRQRAENGSAAVFGQLSYPMTQTVSTTIGARYTRDAKKVRQTAMNNDPADATPGIPLFPGEPYDLVAQDSWSSLTGKIGVDYRPSANRLFFASINRGYKAGMFPSQNNVVQTVARATPAEKVLSYELGTKLQSERDRMSAALCLFSMRYQDLQLLRLDEHLRLLTFTEDADIQGGEMEFRYRPLAQMYVGLSYAYLDARVRGGANDGDRLARAPSNKFSSFMRVEWTDRYGTLSGGMDYEWTDKFSSEVPNSRVMQVAPYGLLNAFLRHSLGKSGFTIALWGKNLTNEKYIVHTTPFMGNGFSIFGAPRTYGLDLKYEWH